MKKRIIALVLTLILSITCTATAFASDAVADELAVSDEIMETVAETNVQSEEIGKVIETQADNEETTEENENIREKIEKESSIDETGIFEDEISNTSEEMLNTSEDILDEAETDAEGVIPEESTENFVDEDSQLFETLSYDGQCGNNVWWSLSDGMLRIVGAGNMYNYHSSNPPWYSFKEEITSVFITSDVTSIGTNAFKDCTYLTNVYVGEGVTMLWYYAFKGCTRLTQINWNAKNCDIANIYGLDAFYDAGIQGKGINVIFGENVGSVPAYMFYESNNAHTAKVTCVTINAKRNFYIRPYAFYGCTEIEKICATENGWEISWGTGNDFSNAVWHHGDCCDIDYVDHVCPNCNVIEYISSPNLKKISSSSSGIRVEWYKVTGTSKYSVYRKTSNSSWTKIGETSKNAYKDSTAKVGVQYSYTVKCLNKSGTVISKYDTDGLTSIILKTPGIAVKGYSSYIRIAWSEVKGATGYKIYRKASNESSYKGIAVVKGGTRYKDKTAKKGVTYTYCVKAYAKINGHNIWSAVSVKKSAKR